MGGAVKGTCTVSCCPWPSSTRLMGAASDRVSVHAFLPAVGIDFLEEVAVRVHKTHRHQGKPQVAAFLEVVPGQKTQAPGVKRQGPVQPILQGEISDGVALAAVTFSVNQQTWVWILRRNSDITRHSGADRPGQRRPLPANSGATSLRASPDYAPFRSRPGDLSL